MCIDLENILFFSGNIQKQLKVGIRGGSKNKQTKPCPITEVCFSKEMGKIITFMPRGSSKWAEVHSLVYIRQDQDDVAVGIYIISVIQPALEERKGNRFWRPRKRKRETERGEKPIHQERMRGRDRERESKAQFSFLSFLELA